MSHYSENPLHDAQSASKSASAQIIPFERPPNVLQRAVQLRAQEALERDRERDKVRPAPLRWAVILVLAAIPVFLLIGAVDAFVRVFHHVNASFSTPSAPAEGSATPRESASQPGVVMIKPLQEKSSVPPQQPAAPAAESN